MSASKPLEVRKADVVSFLHDNFQVFRNFFKLVSLTGCDMRQVLEQFNFEEATKASVSNLDNTSVDVEMQAGNPQPETSTFVEVRRKCKGQKRPPGECDSDSSESPPANRQKKQQIAVPVSAGPSSPATPSEQHAQATSSKVPPIILKDRKLYSDVLSILKSLGVATLRPAVVKKDGIQFFLANPSDFRSVQKCLKDKKIPFFTFVLPEDKTLKVVIRGIPNYLENEVIAAELKQQNIQINSVTRMSNPKTKEPYPMVLVDLPRDQKQIYDVALLCNAKVRVEAKRRNNSTSQCHNCQGFGHSSRNCFCPPICVKCAKPHATSECKMAKDKQPKCVRCNGPHTASYAGCPSWPKPPKAVTKTAPKPAPASRIPGMSYAAVVNKTAAQQKSSATTAPPKSAPPKAAPKTTQAASSEKSLRELFMEIDASNMPLSTKQQLFYKLVQCQTI